METGRAAKSGILAKVVKIYGFPLSEVHEDRRKKPASGRERKALLVLPPA